MHYKQVLFAFIIIASFSYINPLFKNDISPEDKKTIANLDKDIASLEGQETDQEYFIYLHNNRYLVRSIITRIDLLMRKYPHNHTVENFIEAHDYLKRTMARFGL